MNYYIASNLKLLRKKKGENQASIGDLVNKGYTTIGNWETGITKPNWDEVTVLAKYFGVPEQDFVFKDLSKGNLTDQNQVYEKGNLIGNPMGNPITQNGHENQASSLKMIIEAKDQVINSHLLTIQALQSLLNLRDQEVMRLSEENERLKREVPEIQEHVADRSGKHGSKKTA